MNQGLSPLAATSSHSSNSGCILPMSAFPFILQMMRPGCVPWYRRDTILELFFIHTVRTSRYREMVRNTTIKQNLIDIPVDILS